MKKSFAVLGMISQPVQQNDLLVDEYNNIFEGSLLMVSNQVA